VGINLLREASIAEVSLVAILDADKEGFLRSERSLIQRWAGGAAHQRMAILLCRRETDSIKRAIAETTAGGASRLRTTNAHSITPKGVIKRIKDLIDGVYDASEMTSRAGKRARYEAMSEKQIAREIRALEKRCSSTRRTGVRGGGEGADPARRLKKRVFRGGARPPNEASARAWVFSRRFRVTRGEDGHAFHSARRG